MLLEFIIFVLAFTASLLLAYEIGYSHGVDKTFKDLAQILEETIEEVSRRGDGFEIQDKE